MAHISMGDIDLLHPPAQLEQQRHKLKRLVQKPNSFFMDVNAQAASALPRSSAMHRPSYFAGAAQQCCVNLQEARHASLRAAP
eukprot:CAMPEP_0119328296 /NCGR_PEP_ID=MMETSP1333-20130426/72981_1 /TAXON_ID=418940 /ORGANISM="Scyphosphaera apsteinii, Strain RCC1455" /LENGTH=82 /DNA_ID=CAMNT_0007337103 /DNA_START=57 /DNA_END=306 /DNA_ORIENTATION=+